MTHSNPFRVAALQMVSGEDVEGNCQAARKLIEEAVGRGANLVALPECFPLLSGDDTAKLRIAEPFGEGPLQRFLADCARHFGVWLVGGTVPLAADTPERVRNATLVFDPNGECLARYDKIHLFGFQRDNECYDESRTIEAGRHPVTFESPIGKVGVAVCYDLRFPELFRAVAPVSLMVVTAAFTHTTGSAHWEVLLRARAIENQCYVLASAQGGVHPSGRRTFGDSMIIDPWGVVVDRLPSGPGVVVAEFDPDRLHSVRESLPALRHRIL